MADYRETDVVGKSWQRAYRVRIDNPTGQVTSLTFYEETVTNLDGRVITDHVGTLTAQFDATNPAHLELYGKLNELYVLLREARDATPDEVPV